MARTYRDIAMEQMLGTVEEAMSQAINWWGDLPPPMKEAIDEFRIQLGAAIDSVEFVGLRGVVWVRSGAERHGAPRLRVVSKG